MTVIACGKNNLVLIRMEPQKKKRVQDGKPIFEENPLPPCSVHRHVALTHERYICLIHSRKQSSTVVNASPRFFGDPPQKWVTGEKKNPVFHFPS
jgi:hypothetical protein